MFLLLPFFSFPSSGNRVLPQQGTKDISKKRYRRVKPSQKSGATDGYGSSSNLFISLLILVRLCACKDPHGCFDCNLTRWALAVGLYTFLVAFLRAYAISLLVLTRTGILVR